MLRALAILLLCALPLTAAAQSTGYGRLVENRLSAFERELRTLTGSVERLQQRLTGLERRIEALELARQQAESAEEPAPAEAAPPVAGAPVAPAAPAGPQETAPDAPAALPRGVALSLYEQGRRFQLQARYGDAEGVFAAFLRRFPEHRLAGNARHWLADSLARQGKHGAAAQQFLAAYEEDRGGSKAPDNLLKLARALAALDKQSEACIALRRLAREHADAPQAVTTAAAAESRRLEC